MEGQHTESTHTLLHLFGLDLIIFFLALAAAIITIIIILAFIIPAFITTHSDTAKKKKMKFSINYCGKNMIICNNTFYILALCFPFTSNLQYKIHIYSYTGIS